MRGIAVIRPGATTGDIGHAIQAYAEARALQRGARFLRPRRRPPVPRRAQHPALRHGPARASCCSPGMIFTVEPMINLGRPHVKVLVRRLDGGDARPLAVGAVRAHGGGHRDRRRDLHPVAHGPGQAALRGVIGQGRVPREPLTGVPVVLRSAAPIEITEVADLTRRSAEWVVRLLATV